MCWVGGGVCVMHSASSEAANTLHPRGRWGRTSRAGKGTAQHDDLGGSWVPRGRRPSRNTRNDLHRTDVADGPVPGVVSSGDESLVACSSSEIPHCHQVSGSCGTARTRLCFKAASC